MNPSVPRRSCLRSLATRIPMTGVAAFLLLQGLPATGLASAGVAGPPAAPDDTAFHAGYAFETVLDAATAPEITGFAFLPGGSLAVSHWGGDRNKVSDLGKVVLLAPVAGSPGKWASRDLAAGLRDPAGLAFLRNALYVGETHRISRVTLDGVRATLVDVATSGNNHEYDYSLVERAGKLYATLGQAFPPMPSKDRGLAVEVDPATGQTTFLAGGLREPNGLVVGPEGELFATDNQGHWVPTSKLVHIVKGRDFGYDNPLAPFGEVAPTAPALWLPHGELFNSPGQPAYLHSGPFAGQMLIGDVCGGGIRRACLEKVKGTWQGAVMRFLKKGVITGPLRMAQAADGSIWFGGLRGIPGFACDYFPGGGKNGLYKLKPTGQSPFEVLAMHSREGGYAVEFTRPVASGLLADKASFEVDQFRYQATADYGGPKLDGERLTVTAVRASADNRKAMLDISGLKEGRVVHIRFRNLRADGGQALWQEEIWYTANRLGPADAPTHVTPLPGGGAARTVRPYRALSAAANVLINGRQVRSAR